MWHFEDHMKTWDIEKSCWQDMKQRCDCLCGRNYTFVARAQESFLGESWASINSKTKPQYQPISEGK